MTRRRVLQDSTEVGWSTSSAAAATRKASRATRSRFKKYWAEYVAFLEDELRLAPDEIHDEVEIYSEVPKVQLTSIFEKYDYDVARMEAEGTDARGA